MVSYLDYSILFTHPFTEHNGPVSRRPSTFHGYMFGNKPVVSSDPSFYNVSSDDPLFQCFSLSTKGSTFSGIFAQHFPPPKKKLKVIHIFISSELCLGSDLVILSVCLPVCGWVCLSGDLYVPVCQSLSVCLSLVGWLVVCPSVTKIIHTKYTTK